jgi:hypothetical protein
MVIQTSFALKAGQGMWWGINGRTDVCPISTSKDYQVVYFLGGRHVASESEYDQVSDLNSTFFVRS